MPFLSLSHRRWSIQQLAGFRLAASQLAASIPLWALGPSLPTPQTTIRLLGVAALLSNTTGSDNTASGALALFANTDGESNSAFGRDALASNITGDFNTAMGRFALLDNESGSFNTAIGVEALADDVDGTWNTAVGYRSTLDQYLRGLSIPL